MTGWENVVERSVNPTSQVDICLVGKYVELKESYKSLNEALAHGGLGNNCKVNINFVDAELIEDKGAEAELAKADAILVAPGFGSRGTEGKIMAAQFARENKIPYFGICLGMQIAVIEFSRNVAGLANANSTELDPSTPFPVIDIMDEQRDVTEKGATMRLGAYKCTLAPGTKAAAAYGQEEIRERHRHRFEVNNKFLDKLTDAGLIVSGRNPERNLVEMVELSDHPYFVACQFHPEFKSRPQEPHELFHAFVAAALEQRAARLGPEGTLSETESSSKDGDGEDA